MLGEFGDRGRPEGFDASRWRALRRMVWGPVPWMLEAPLVVLVVLGDYAGVAAIAALLAFNGALCLCKEECARREERR